MTHPAVSPEDSVLDRAALLERFGRPRNGRLVFTNGCFDLLHRGHVEYLFAARALGDALVVGVNTDDSVRRLKGAGRPVVPVEDRMFVLAGLACVDAVTPFGEDTPRELIAALLPDVLVKGGDYRAEDVVGGREVRAAGGDIVILPFVEGRSTTALIERLERRG
ncbi:MAG TPA: D-glycero-beta-D-manno-heptose 1-phosphate adenylyltransferase [Longimicrobiales bacterium]|nr:D-glycero-beta-D-manno-heptose 1-phosphate adenylyltransferase [Longimicrobiales bacterium]